MKKHQAFNPWVWVGLVASLLVAASFVTSLFAKEEKNPLREEMEGLDLAFKEIIDAVVLGDMSLIPPALAKAQEARDKRNEIVRGGVPVSLPKNANRMDDFSLFDRKFQIDLLELRRAAETGQKRAVRNHVHKLLDACVGCHERFRK